MLQAIETTVRNAILKYLATADPEKLTDDANLVEDLGCDSLDVVEIVMTLENELTIDINDDLFLEHGKTVGGVVRVCKHIKLGHPL